MGIGIHNNNNNGVMCSNSSQTSGGMPVCRGNVQATNFVNADAD